MHQLPFTIADPGLPPPLVQCCCFSINLDRWRSISTTKKCSQHWIGGGGHVIVDFQWKLKSVPRVLSAIVWKTFPGISVHKFTHATLAIFCMIILVDRHFLTKGEVISIISWLFVRLFPHFLFRVLMTSVKETGVYRPTLPFRSIYWMNCCTLCFCLL